MRLQACRFRFWGPTDRPTRDRVRRMGAGTAARRRRRAALEFLEDRALLTAPQTFVVNQLLDSGKGSLREAIASANADSYSGSAYDTIRFDPSLAGQTINLTTVGDSTAGPSALAITAPVLIDGSTAPGLTIARSSSASAFRLFTVGVTGKLTLQDLTISGGQDNSTSGGGGLYTSTGTVTLTNTTFTNNSAQKGGGLYNAFGTVTLTNTTFTNNSAQYVGGLYNAGTATLANVTFSNNSATAQNGGGGGLGNSGTATLTNTTFTGNSAQTGGGLYNVGIVTLTNTTFGNNSAQDYGGGIWNSGTATLTNDTFTGNSAHLYGGGLYNAGTATLTNDTFTHNSAQTGGGLYNSRTATLTNTIVAGNLLLGSSYPAAPREIEGTVTGANNLIGDPSSAGGLANGVNGNLVGTSGNPIALGTLFALTTGPNPVPLLASNGGPTPTVALAVGSPAINAGSDTTQAPYQLTTDQRGPGFPREVGSEVDIGAYEAPLAHLAVTVVGPTFGALGMPITYTLTVSNNGPNDAQTVTLTDVLPSALTFVSQSQPPTGAQFTLGNTGNSLSDTIATLPVGASQTVTIIATINANDAPNGTITHTATASSSTTTDPAPASGQATTRIDGVSPTSSVDTLPAALTATSFQLTWAGSDDPGGSGIASYDVLVSTDHGGFVPFLTGTSLTSAVFSGAFGHSYGFYSVATDEIGNRQPTPTSAQATTFLDLPPVAHLADPAAGSTVSDWQLDRRKFIDVTFTSPTGQSINPNSILDPAQEFILTGAGVGSVKVNGAPTSRGGNTFRYSFTGAFASGPVNLGFSPGSFTDSLGVPNLASTESYNVVVPSLWIDSPQPIRERNGAPLAFTVRLTAPIANAVTVSYATANGSAVAGKNYQATKGALTFGPGKPLTRTITVPVLRDGKYGNDVTFAVKLALSKGSVPIAQGRASGIIRESDSMPKLSIGDITVRQRASGTSTATFTVTLSGATTKVTTVDYATTDGTATVADHDYRPALGTLSFAPGVSRKTITVLVYGDPVFEPNETFQVRLSNPSNSTLSRAVGKATITHTSPKPRIVKHSLTVSNRTH